MQPTNRLHRNAYGNPHLHLLQDGGIYTNRGLGGFPEDGVWSADNRILAFCSQSSGGLDQLIYHGAQPQSANAFLLRNPAGSILMTIRVETGEMNAVISHRFDSVTIYPYGWENKFSHAGLEFTTRLCVIDTGLVWSVSCFNHRDVGVRIAPVLHLNPEALTFPVNGTRTLGAAEILDGALCIPIHDRLRTKDWIDVPGFKDVLIDANTLLAIGGENAASHAIDSSICLSGETIPPGMQGSQRSFFVVCGPAREDASSALSKMRSASDTLFTEQSRRYDQRLRSIPTFEIGAYRGVAAVSLLAPFYAEATKVGDSGALRSSSGGYYFVWGWDSLMGGHELSHWGDTESTYRLLEFIATHRSEEGCVPHRYDNDLQPLHVTSFDLVSQLFISLLYQTYSETLDGELLDRYYPVAQLIFEQLAKTCDPRGFFKTMGMYPDAPPKLERTSESLVAYEVGFWYCVCRMVEILAYAMGDQGNARRAAEISEQIETHYLDAFFDAQNGFVVDALVGAEYAPNGTYPRYSLFPMHNAFGAWLFHPIREALSHFVQEHLFKPDGIRMVPIWDKHIGTETVTGDCWFLHFDLYCLKAFRRARDGAGLKRWLELAESYLKARHVIPELQVLDSGGDRQVSWNGLTGQIWQLFALSGWSRGLLEGILGFETDYGGLTYIPCDLDFDVCLRKFPFRGGEWDFAVSGSGAWVAAMRVDGQEVVGALKIPSDAYSPGSHRVEVVRSEKPPLEPLLLEAAGASLGNPRIENSHLKLKLFANNHVSVIFYAPERPVVFLDGVKQDYAWDPKHNLGRLYALVRGSADLLIACG